MANPFYVYDGAFLPATGARAEAVATEFQAVQAGFAVLAYQGTDSGAANAYVVTTNGSPTGAYQDGNVVEFTPANANSVVGATISVNGLPVVNLKRGNGLPLQPGDLAAGVWY